MSTIDGTQGLLTGDSKEKEAVGGEGQARA